MLILYKNLYSFKYMFFKILNDFIKTISFYNEAILNSIYLIIYLSNYISIRLSFHLPIYTFHLTLLKIGNLYNHETLSKEYNWNKKKMFFLYIYILLCMYLSFYLCIYLPIYVSIFLSIYLSLYLCIYLSIYVSIFLSII